MKTQLRPKTVEQRPRYRAPCDWQKAAQADRKERTKDIRKLRDLAKKHCDYSHNSNVYRGKNLSDNNQINKTVNRHLNAQKKAKDANRDPMKELLPG